MIGAISKWLGSASELTILMAQIDKIVHHLTGNNPKHFHPTLYRHLLDSINEVNLDLKLQEGVALNHYEGALLMLYLLRKGAEQAEESGQLNPSHRVDVYHSALNHHNLQYKQHIRPGFHLMLSSLGV